MPPLVCSHFPADFLKQMQTFRDDRFLCDVRLIADDRIEFPAHRLVLAASSSYFQKLFQKKRDDQDVTTIQLKNCNSECVTVVLQFLYSGELHLRDCDPGKVLNMAKACQIDALEMMLTSTMNNNNISSVGGSVGVKVKLEPTVVTATESDDGDDNKEYVTKTSRNNGNKRHAKNGVQYEETPTSTVASQIPYPAIDFLRRFCQIHSLLGYQCNCPDETLLTTVNPAVLQFFFSQAAPGLFNGAANYGPPPAKLLRTSLPQTYDVSQISPTAVLPIVTSPTKPAVNTSNASSPPKEHHNTNGTKSSAAISVKVPNLESATESDCTLSPLKESEMENGGQLPVDDRDGWCRNKKYIKKTLNGGYQCTICKKTYGRYNSVSYHVTIYHRNPPIQCDQPGCTFSTREARYIHFHKYYRHDIALPTNIDLESRRCPFCKHVAKSPAMLEKHVNRHMPGSARRTTSSSTALAANKVYKCELCNKDFSSKPQLTQHIAAVHKNDDKTLACDQCSYRGKTVTTLEQHKLFKHSGTGGLWCSKLKCEECNYTTPSELKLIAHKSQVHKMLNGKMDGGEDEHAMTYSDHSDSCLSGADDEVASDNGGYSMVTVEPGSADGKIDRSVSLDDFSRVISVVNKTSSSSDISVSSNVV